MSTIKNFTELQVWQKSHGLVLFIYAITKQFPPEEKYSLSSQLRRAAVSVVSNIVEGFNRRSVNDSINFYYIARASLEEAKCQLMIAKDLKYISASEYSAIVNQCEEVGKMLTAWTISQKRNSRI